MVEVCRLDCCVCDVTPANAVSATVDVPVAALAPESLDSIPDAPGPAREVDTTTTGTSRRKRRRRKRPRRRFRRNRPAMVMTDQRDQRRHSRWLRGMRRGPGIALRPPSRARWQRRRIRLAPRQRPFQIQHQTRSPARARLLWTWTSQRRCHLSNMALC